MYITKTNETHTGDKQKLGGWGCGWGRDQKYQSFPKHHRIIILGLKWVANLWTISDFFFLGLFIIPTVVEYLL